MKIRIFIIKFLHNIDYTLINMLNDSIHLQQEINLKKEKLYLDVLS